MEPVILDGLIPMGLVQSPLGVVMFDAELRVVWVNEAAVRLSGGTPAGRWPGRRLGEVLPCMDADVIERSLRRGLAARGAGVDLEGGSRVGDCGARRFWNSCLFRIDGPDGETAGLACMMREVTEQAQNQHRLALVDEASARIGTTLDITRTAEELLDVALARLADAGAVDLLATVIEGDQHAPHAHDQKMHLRRGARPRAGALMGMVVLYRVDGSRPCTSADLSLARGLVARAAVSMDNARHYTRERATALALQRGLLPRQIPDVLGLELACRYIPAQTAAEIGGDWFDVIPLPEGRCALTVGDPTGHDIRAASLLGHLRTVTRTLATLDLAPADILTRLDQITTDLTDDETGATCIYAG